MARAEDLAWKPAQWTVVASAVNGAATATKDASTNFAHYITGVTVSASDLPTNGAAQVQIKNGSSVLDQWEIPAAVFAPIPINFVRPYACSVNTDASISIGAMGTGVRGTVVLRGFTSTP